MASETHDAERIRQIRQLAADLTASTNLMVRDLGYSIMRETRAVLIQVTGSDEQER